MYSCFYEDQKFLDCSMQSETCQLEKTEDNENVFQALGNSVKEKHSCLWSTFYQMDFMRGQRYVAKIRLVVEFVQKVPATMFIGQQMKQQRHDKKY